MTSRPSLGAFVAWLLVAACALVACTGDDEIYATPRVSPVPDASTGASSSGGSSGASGSSSGSAVTPDSGANDGSAGDGSAVDGSTDGGDGGIIDSGADTGVDSGPVVCSVVACAAHATCTALGCGSCNMGQGFCKP